MEAEESRRIGWTAFCAAAGIAMFALARFTGADELMFARGVIVVLVALAVVAVWVAINNQYEQKTFGLEVKTAIAAVAGGVAIFYGIFYDLLAA